MSDINSVIADRVRGVIAEKRLTQQNVSHILGISRTSVNDRLNGKVPFTAPEILALSRITGISIDRFFPESASARRKVGRAA